MSPEAIVDRLNRAWPGSASLLGAHALAWDPDRSELIIAFMADERFCHTDGTILQGGFSTSMLDATMAYAGLSADDTITGMPSLEIKVSFIAPGSPGTFVCVGRPVHMGRSVGFFSAELYQGDRMVATATSTFKLVRKKAEG